MLDGPRLRAIRDHLPIVPLVPGRVWDVLQAANHYDIWVASTTPNPDSKIGIALIDLERINAILLTANICDAVCHMVRDCKAFVVYGDIHTKGRVRIILVVNRDRLAL